MHMALITLLAATEEIAKAGKSIGLGVGGGLGAVGAGVGIGIIFGKIIEGITRQPEMRDEITAIQAGAPDLTPEVEACEPDAATAGTSEEAAAVNGVY